MAYNTYLGINPQQQGSLYSAIERCKTDEEVIRTLKLPSFRAEIPTIVARFQIEVDNTGRVIDQHMSLKERICGLIAPADVEKCRATTTLFRNRHAFQNNSDAEHVSLSINTEQMHMNRLVLMSEIPYFAALFASGMKESSQKQLQLSSDMNLNSVRLALKFAQADESSRQGFLDHLHRDEKNTSDVYQLLVLSNRWGMQELRELCEEWILDNIDFTIQRAMKWKARLECQNAPKLLALFNACEKLSVENNWNVSAQNFDFTTFPKAEQYKIIAKARTEIPRKNVIGHELSVLKEKLTNPSSFCVCLDFKELNGKMLAFNTLKAYLTRQGFVIEKSDLDRAGYEYVRFPQEIGKSSGVFLKTVVRERIDRRVQSIACQLEAALKQGEEAVQLERETLFAEFPELMKKALKKQEFVVEEFSVTQHRVPSIEKPEASEPMVKQVVIVSKAPLRTRRKSTEHPWVHPTCVNPVKQLSDKPPGSCVIQKDQTLYSVFYVDQSKNIIRMDPLAIDPSVSDMFDGPPNSIEDLIQKCSIDIALSPISWRE